MTLKLKNILFSLIFLALGAQAVDMDAVRFQIAQAAFGSDFSGLQDHFEACYVQVAPIVQDDPICAAYVKGLYDSGRSCLSKTPQSFEEVARLIALVVGILAEFDLFINAQAQGTPLREASPKLQAKLAQLVGA